MDSWLVTADATRYISGATSTTTPFIQTSPTARHRLLVHHPHSPDVQLAVVNTRETKQLLRSLSSSHHYYIKAAYNKTSLAV